MRNSKIVALVAAAALLVVGAAFTAFAANTGWVQENGTWKYQKNGEYVYDTWAPSGADYYYLDENGELAGERFVEGSNGYLYYANKDGKMVTNDWVKIDNTDDVSGYDQVIYYYFQASGKAYKAGSENKTSFKTINGKKYAFDADGRMLWGWVNSTATMANDTDVSAWVDALYWCGSETDGAQRTGWHQIAVFDSSVEDVDQTYWFYFGANGQKYYNKTATINGQKYTFDARGKMITSWASSTTVTTVPTFAGQADVTVFNSKYYKTEGQLVRKGWFQAVPTEGQDKDSYDADSKVWFYGQNDGTIVANCIRSINGKKYIFNTSGEMLSGLVLVDLASMTANTVDKIDTMAKIKAIISADDVAKKLYYFSGDGEKDGSMKTGSQTVTVDGDSYKLFFSTSNATKGQGFTGKSGNAYYFGGIKIAADADTASYQFFKLTDGVVKTFTAETVAKGRTFSSDEYVLVTTSGSIVKNGTRKDGNGLKYTYDATTKLWTVVAE